MAKRKRVTFGGSGKKVSFLIRMDEMDLVFKKAKEKAISRIAKAGNTATPWKDFSIEHLEIRLVEEFNEWMTNETSELENPKNDEELLDVINLAVFVYLAKRTVD